MIVLNEAHVFSRTKFYFTYSLVDLKNAVKSLQEFFAISLAPIPTVPCFSWRSFEPSDAILELQILATFHVWNKGVLTN